MKKLFLIFPLLFFILSCESEGELTKDVIPETAIPDDENPSDDTNSQLRGKFQPTSGISVTGDALIFSEDNLQKLKFSNFSVSNGPDLKVYLSKTSAPTAFINLGNLRANTVYTIPNQTNLSEYKYVLIYCQQYSHLFAFTELTPN